MNNFILSVVTLILFPVFGYSQYSLKIEITELQSNTGKIMIQLFDEKENIVAKDMSDIKEKRCSFTFNNLKPGKYAVRYYHDENLNQTMETNMVGKPLEGYGFSNNVTGRFGPPPFDKWLFDLNENKTISLKPVY
jgi:uncharacterized protein (DUF2141 family)